MRSPDRRLYIDVDVPAKPFKPFSMKKGFLFAKGKSLQSIYHLYLYLPILLVPCIIRNLEHNLIVDSSLYKEGSTNLGGGSYWVSVFEFILFRHKWSPPVLESNKGMHGGVVTSTWEKRVKKYHPIDYPKQEHPSRLTHRLLYCDAVVM